MKARGEQTWSLPGMCFSELSPLADKGELALGHPVGASAR